MGRRQRQAKSAARPDANARQARPDELASGLSGAGVSRRAPLLVRSVWRSVVPSPVELLFAATLFLSAALLFAVQPMFAKMVLPLLGGAPAVWNSCLVFYQAMLLLGYLYAHLSVKWLGPRRQAAWHMLFLCLPWVVLPIGVAKDWLPPPDVFPVFWLWMLLLVSVGLPFLVVSASAPTLQAWFAQTGGRSARDPYFLYAASNLGSLLALLGYPLLIESHLTLGEQAWWWAGGYGLLMLLAAGCAVRLWRSAPAGATAEPGGVPDEAHTPDARPLTLRRRLHWLALSLVPSSLLMGVTTYISTDVGQIPLLWVFPLALYLLTFVLVFARRSVLPLRWTLAAEPLLIVAAAAVLACNTLSVLQLLAVGSLQLAAFFVIAMVCHGQLAADRPAGSHLTEFYLWMSLGGVLGGLLNALAAPLLFSGAAEYPLMMVAACLLRPWPPPSRRSPWAWARGVGLPAAVLAVCAALVGMMLWQFDPLEWRYSDVAATSVAVVISAAAAAFCLRRRPPAFGLAVAALLGISLWYPNDRAYQLHAERSFFGVLRVTEAPLWNAHILYHGSTTHGSQSLDRQERHEPWTYYHRNGPLGRIFSALQTRRPFTEIGVLGLGTGTVAAYGLPGQRITFYEIDPAVKRIAEDPKYFTYLADCRAKVEIILGDARLSLVHGPPRQFDLLVVDVFSGDTVPIHLLTRQALQIYLGRLAPQGLLAIHISNRYLDLEPILGRLAADLNAVAWVCYDSGAVSGYNELDSLWVVVTRRDEHFSPLAADPAWNRLRADGGRVWTDDFSNLVDTLKWNLSWGSLWPQAWWKSQSEKAAFHQGLGAMLFGQRRFEEAIAQFQQALELQPDSVTAHLSIGSAWDEQGKPDRAAAEFRKALQIQPECADAHYRLGLALQAQGKADQALEHLRRALQIEPNFVDAYNDLGNLLAGQGRVEEAIDHYRKALALRPDVAELHNNLGSMLAGQGAQEEALEHFRKAVELKPDYVGARENLGALLLECGKPAEAIAQFRKILEIQPDCADAHNRLGLILQSQGKVDEAVAHHREALRIEPRSATAHCGLGQAIQEQGKFREAIGHYQKALEAAPEYALAANNLAWLWATCPDASLRSGAKAIELAQRALRLPGGEDPTFLDTLAAAYAEVGRFSEAVQTARKALELANQHGEPTLAEAIEKRIRLYESQTPYRATSSPPGGD